MAADGIERCLDEVTAATGGSLSRDEAMSMLSLVDERAERLGRERGLSGADAARAAAQELSDMEAAAAAVEKRNSLLNLAKRISRRENIETIGQTVGSDEKPDLAHGMMNQVVARNAPAPGSRLSAEALWRTRETEYKGALAVPLAKAGLLKAFRKGSMDRDWGLELYELSMQSAGEDGHPGVTGNSAALKIAQTIHGAQQLAKQRLNREGAWIGDYAGYITRTSHDMDKIRRAGFDTWRSFVEPRLSAQTFEGVEDRTKFLRSVFNALQTGVHLSDREAVGLKDPAFTGPLNAAEAVSQARTLHWNNADAWMDYQQRFGTGTLAEQVNSSLARAARQEALMARWGTNPEAEFLQDFRALEEKYRDSNPEQVVELRQKQAAIQKRFDYLTGAANRPENKLAAEISAGLRAITSMAKLGNVAFTHLSAFPTGAAELRYHGVGWLEAYGNGISALLQGRGKGEARELADLLLAGVEGMHGSMLSRFYSDDAVPGTVAKLSNRFFQLAGLTYMLNAKKSGIARVMSRYLGSMVDREFGALPDEMQRTLSTYNISPAEWDTLRNAPDHVTVDGRVHLTPDAATRAGLDPAAADRLGLKLHALYSDIADRSVVTPGLDERALLYGGAKPGSAAGEALRFVMQFKTWGTAAVRQGLGRELYGGQGAAGAISGLAQLTLGLTVMGYVSMTLKDLAAGRTPRNPLDPRTILAALMQGGGFGIMGDYLFGEFGRFGHTALESAAGPVAGTVADVITLLDLVRGIATRDPNANPKDFGPELLRLAENNTPFINLFFVRRALDYLLLHSLQESMNPGYLQRAQRSLQKRTGQTYMLSPQNHLHTFGR